MKKYYLHITAFCFAVTTALLGFQTQRQYTLTGTPEQMIALRIAVEQTTMPHNEALKVEGWLITQLLRQDAAFARQDSIVKAKQDSISKAKKP